MKICKPTTMYGQVLLTVFAGIVIVHCLMLFLAVSLGINYFHKSFLEDRARYLISNYVLLDAVEGDSRRNMAQLLSNKGLNIELSSMTPVFNDGINANSVDMEHNLTDLVAEGAPYIGEEKIIAEVSEIEALSLSALLTNYQENESEGVYLARVGMAFSDGTWVTFTDHGVRAPMPKPYSFTFTVISIVCIGMFAFYIVYRTLQPLKLFARATEQFGLNVAAAVPLEVKGPLEVRETILAFNKMQERIVQFVEERSRLLAAISHDLRTPLTRMNLRIEQLEEPHKTAFSKDINQLRQLMDTGIDLARATANTEKPALVDVIALLESMVDDMRYQGADIDLCDENQQLSEPISPVLVPPLCIKRALSNILENAIRYAPSVKVCVKNSSKSITIDVIDNGPGMPEPYMDKVFEPYFRLEPSRNRGTGGTGLGLAITKTMVQLCKGTISMKNNPEGGLKVSIIIPR